MPVIQIDLGLTAIQQIPGLCGPACAQMILHARQGAAISTSAADQRQLWAEIRDNTTHPAGHQQPTPEPEGGDCGTFPRKICECPGKGVFCWCTFPSALRKTLLQRSPKARFRVITSRSEVTIQAKIIQCLQNGIAPAVLVFNRKHWVVVGGFDSESATQVKLFDPRFNARLEISLTEWETNYLVAPTCGKFKGKHVVVGMDS